MSGPSSKSVQKRKEPATAPKRGSDIAQSLARNARRMRERLDLSQGDVAKRVGLAQDVYGRIERGTMLPSVPTLAKIAEVLQCTVGHLLEVLISNPGPEGGRHAALLAVVSGASDDEILMITEIAKIILDGPASAVASKKQPAKPQTKPALRFVRQAGSSNGRKKSKRRGILFIS